MLDMRIAGQESEAAWRELLQSLVERHLGTPALAVIDDNPGLRAALQKQWPEIAIQRCTNHKLRNLLAGVRLTCARNWPRITGAWYTPTVARRSNMNALASCANGGCAVRPWSLAG